MAAPRLRPATLLLLGLAVAAGMAVGSDQGESPAADVPASFDKRATIQVPPGFIVEHVAGPPLVQHPMMACFDERGRLFVAEAAGVNLKADELLKNPPNLIRLLEDTDGDGRFDKSTIFADKMTLPMGALWYDEALYAASPPSLWRLEDTHGKGVADKRQELVTKFGFTGNAADIHGPFLGPDGRFYWSDGRHGHEIQRPDGVLLQGKAARIFRCRPDGSDVEVVCGGGMDNPVEIAFTAEGEPFATVDILIGRPSRIDAIIYCVEGGVYPYHEVIKEFKRTGDLLPAVTQLGWVAPAGLMRYRSTALGAEYRDNLLSAQFNTHRIQRHVWERDGGGFRASNENFLVSSDMDFHPTDVLEDADGSLLVIDTGGWFRIGCPTSKIAKAEIKGGIYRIRRQGAPPVSDARGLKLPWDRLSAHELTVLLDDARAVVRDRAVHLLGKQGTGSLAALKEVLHRADSSRARRNAVWALTRIEALEARAAVRDALQDKEVSVRLAAAHSAGLYRDAAALPQLTALLQADHAALRRQAATALGRLRQSAAVPGLFEALRAGTDRFLEHALLYALIEIADRPSAVERLRDASPLVRRAALIALDQMNGGNLTRELVTPLLNTQDPALVRTTLAIISNRPGWAGETIGLLRSWLGEGDLDPGRQESLRSVVSAFCTDPAVQDLIAQVLRQEKTPVATRLLLLETIGRVPLDKLPATWVGELRWSLEHPDERVVRQATACIRSAKVAEFDHVLVRLAQDSRRPEDLRVVALAAAAPRLDQLGAPLFEFLTKCLHKDRPPLLRLSAAEALGSVRLEDGQLQALGKVMATTGALELPHLLAAFETSKNLAVGQRLVAALSQAPGLPSLSPEALRRTVQAYPEEVRQAAEPLLKKLAVDTEQQKARLVELEATVAAGDAPRGREVFFGTKAACSACHAVRSEGGRVGPDLTTIGAIRAKRDLLESIVFPSASFVRGYEPFVITTRDGRIHTGIIGRETVEAIYLHTAERAEIRVPRASIESIDLGRVSIMPQGLEAQLSRQELGDLIAYLQSLR
jgi:putative membrane-bound dehydrogenase-like protein